MNRWTRDVLIMAAATAASRLIGLARDIALAHRFGMTAAYDAFLIAFFVPHFLRQLLAEGALSTAMVPVYTGLRESPHGDAEPDQFASNLISWLLVFFPVLILLGIILASYYVPFLASGFDPEKLGLSIRLTRIVFPFIGVIGLAAVTMGILNAHHRFFAASVSPVGFNVGMLLGILLLSPHMRPEILGVGVGVLLGGVLQLSAQMPALARAGFRFRFHLRPLHPRLRTMAQLMAPAVLILAVTEVNLLVDNKLASYLGDGGIASLQYAMRLFQLPLGVLAVSIATALLPRFSKTWSQHDEAGFFQHVNEGLVAVALILLPAMVGLMLLGPDLVRLLFERGSFTPQDTARTANVLSHYLIGLAPYGWVYVLTRAAYAKGRPVFALAASALAASVNISLDLLLISSMREAGLALATSVAGISSAVLLGSVMLRGQGLSRTSLHRLGWIALGCVGLAAVVGATHHAVRATAPAIAVLVPTLAGLVFYGVFVRATPLWTIISAFRATDR